MNCFQILALLKNLIIHRSVHRAKAWQKKSQVQIYPNNLTLEKNNQIQYRKRLESAGNLIFPGLHCKTRRGIGLA